MSHSPKSGQIARLVAGELEPEATERLLEHLCDCEICLAEADRRWSSATVLAVPGPKPSQLRSIERRVMGRLASADFGGQLAQLATIGLGMVYLGLLEPFVGFGAGVARDDE